MSQRLNTRAVRFVIAARNGTALHTSSRMPSCRAGWTIQTTSRLQSTPTRLAAMPWATSTGSVARLATVSYTHLNRFGVPCRLASKNASITPAAG